MTLSVHLISVPSEESINSRVVYLNNKGGVLGRSLECDIYLPDQSRNIEKIHGEIRFVDGSYVLLNYIDNSLTLNDKVLVRNKEYPLFDGDLIRLGNYTLLLSMFMSSIRKVAEPTSGIHIPDPFNLDGLNDDESQDEDEKSSDHKRNNVIFSNENVLSDDPFENFDNGATKPIETESGYKDTTAELKTPVPVPENVDVSPIPASETQTNNTLEKDVQNNVEQVVLNESYPKIDPDSKPLLNSNTIQLTTLFDSIDKTLDQFLNQFSPEHLENQFKIYLSDSSFINKEKKYWGVYRKYFHAQHNNDSLRRNFKALLVENMMKVTEKD